MDWLSYEDNVASGGQEHGCENNQGELGDVEVLSGDILC